MDVRKLVVGLYLAFVDEEKFEGASDLHFDDIVQEVFAMAGDDRSASGIAGTYEDLEDGI